MNYFLLATKYGSCLVYTFLLGEVKKVKVILKAKSATYPGNVSEVSIQVVKEPIPFVYY